MNYQLLIFQSLLPWMLFLPLFWVRKKEKLIRTLLPGICPLLPLMLQLDQRTSQRKPTKLSRPNQRNKTKRKKRSKKLRKKRNHNQRLTKMTCSEAAPTKAVTLMIWLQMPRRSLLPPRNAFKRRLLQLQLRRNESCQVSWHPFSKSRPTVQ